MGAGYPSVGCQPAAATALGTDGKSAAPFDSRHPSEVSADPSKSRGARGGLSLRRDSEGRPSSADLKSDMRPE